MSFKAYFGLFVLFFTTTQFWGYVRDLAEGNLSGLTNGSGGILLQGSHPVESASLSPAPMGLLERKSGGLNFVFSENIQGAQLAFFLPRSHGVFGISPLYLTDYTSNYIALPFGFAKELQKNLSFGFSLKPAYAKRLNQSVYSLGIESSLFYNSKSQWNLVYGFGFYDLSFYLAVRNLSFNFGEENLAPRPALHVGTQSFFWQKGPFGLSYYFETVGIHRFDTFPVLTGLSLNYSYFYFRGGFMHHLENALYQGAILGLGFNIPFSHGNLALNYSFLPPYQNRKENFHFISLFGSYGTIDRQSPEVSLVLDNPYFSPNGDGIKDFVVFEINVQDESPISYYRLEIRDEANQLVRLFTKDTRLMEKKFSLSRLFKEFFQKREALVVPQKIRWDGTSEAVSLGEETQPPFLKDGNYYYSFEVSDIHGNTSKPLKGKIVLDNTPCEINLFYEDTSFSPNGDGNKEEFILDISLKAEPRDKISLFIFNEKKQIVYEKKSLAQDFERVFRWNGGDLPEGLYEIVVQAEDEAGNLTQKKISGISLVRQVDFAEIKFSSLGLSPNKDGFYDQITLYPSFSNKKDLISWDLYITAEKPTKEKISPKLIYEWHGLGAQSLPREIIWDGKNMQGKIVNDGIYYVLLVGEYSSGNRPHSATYEIRVDTKAPQVSVTAELDIFSPDGDGTNEEQIFYLAIEDESEILDYELQIYEIQYNDKQEKQRIPFRKFYGQKSFPEKIYWDGKSDEGHLVESATWYEYEAWAQDIFGNKGKSPVAKFETDILVLPTERGLKIRLSAIEFESGSAQVRKKALPILDKLAKTLERYPKYKIKIEGHTDDIGSEEFNLKLSEDRARQVMNYLIQKGIEANRMSFQGIGELKPLVPNTNWYNRSRNRRVEILLFKN